MENFKLLIIEEIEKKYPKPSCDKKNICIYENVLLSHVCNKHTEWNTSKDIINIIREMRYE